MMSLQKKPIDPDKTFLIGYDYPDGNLTTFEIKVNQTSTINLNIKGNNLYFKFKVKETGINQVSSYQCRIYEKAKNHLYYFDSSDDYNLSFYLTDVNINLTQTIWEKHQINLEWDTKPQTFELTTLSPDLRYCTIFNVSLNFDYIQKFEPHIRISFKTDDFHYFKSHDIKICLYFKWNNLYTKKAFEIIYPSEMINQLREEEEAKTKINNALNEYIEKTKSIYDGTNNDDEDSQIRTIQKYNIYYDYIDNSPYFKQKIKYIRNYSDIDFDINCKYMIYLLRHILDDFGITTLQIRYKLLCKEFGKLKEKNSKSLTDLELLSFKSELINENVFDNEDQQEFLIIPLNINNNVLKDEDKNLNDNYTYALNFLTRLVDNLSDLSSMTEVLKQLISSIKEYFIVKI